MPMQHGLVQAPRRRGPSPEAAGTVVHGLFEKHGRCVYTLCRHLLRDPHEAEDAAQQTFLSAHRSILGGTAPRDPAGWLAAIARNECRGRIHARMAEPLPLAVAEGAGEAVEDVARRRAEARELYQAITELPDPQREAVVLREICGLSYDEMSERSGLPVSAVKSVLFRARQRLRSRLSSVRAVASAGSIALAVRDSVFQSLTGYGSGEAAGTVVKLVSLPVAAKLAAATASVAIVGTLGSGSAPRPADTAASANREPAAGTAREARARTKPAASVVILAAVTSAEVADRRPGSGHASASHRAVVRSGVAGPAPQATDPSGRRQASGGSAAQDETSRSYDDRETSWRYDSCRTRDRSGWRGSWSWDERWSRCLGGDDDEPASNPEPTKPTWDGELPAWAPEAPEVPQVPESPASPEAPAEPPTTPEAPSTPVDQGDGSVVDTSAPAEPDAPANPVDPEIP
jgi:RNA polymerase sigma-70 factor (ECF subfamily)